ncbi:hypothetical protein J4401_06025 [Candidatus Woesearchaeota archaeon]|nr:hypothetical protein [Candidatus Woesearchaeota archaeon]
MVDEISYEDLTDENSMYIETLIELLKQKGIIKQEEFDKKLDELFPVEE